MEPIGYVIVDSNYTGSMIHEKGGDDCLPVYLAPVRTKDLTDVEVEKVWRKHGGYMVMPIDFARAVITADREKTAIMALDVDPVSTSPECVDETGKAEQHVNWSWKYNAQWEGYFCYPKNDTVPFAKIIVYGSPEEQDRDMRLIAETMGEQSTNLCQNPDKLVEKRGRAGSFGGD